MLLFLFEPVLELLLPDEGEHIKLSEQILMFVHDGLRLLIVIEYELPEVSVLHAVRVFQIHVDCLMPMEGSSMSSESGALVRLGKAPFTSLKVFNPRTGRIVGMMIQLAHAMMRIPVHRRNDKASPKRVPDGRLLRGLRECASDVVSDQFEARKELLQLLEDSERVLGSITEELD